MFHVMRDNLESFSKCRTFDICQKDVEAIDGAGRLYFIHNL
jgi:hypothetical protein